MSEQTDFSADPTKKKGPTRSRKEAEAARQRPLVPTDRKLAKKQARAKKDEAWARQRRALETGDERYLPARDKGRVRRYTRDYIDSRWSFSEFLLPAMLIFLAAMLLISVVPLPTMVASRIILGVTIFFYLLLFGSFIEGYVVWHRIKKNIAQRWPKAEIPKGSWFYAYSRMMMARRWRSPKALVERGELNKKKDA